MQTIEQSGRVNAAFERLEPCEAKVSCTVLMGLGGGNTPWLPGDLAIEGWSGDTLRPRTWKECRDFAVFIGGPNPALRDDQPYSNKHFDVVCERYGSVDALDRYETVFVDSITVAGRLCFQYCKGEPQAFSEKTGKFDMRGAYGLHAQEMVSWLTHLQHTRNKNIWFVGILDDKTDDFGRRFYQPQIEGTKTGLELPGIVDQVITMAEVPGEADEAKGKSKPEEPVGLRVGLRIFSEKWCRDGFL
jgi:hypothetical protein